MLVPISVVLANTRRRPSIRVGLPWAASLAVWVAMARLAVAGTAFDGGALYWLAVGAVVVPLAVLLSSLVASVFPSKRSVGACVVASEGATLVSVILLHYFREPGAFVILGGFFVSLVATASYVVASSTGETARRDAEDP